MPTFHAAHEATHFRWAVGIENTFVPHTRAGHRPLDEYELMDHYRLWKHDLDLAADLGVSTIRYGVPWYKVNPKPGVYDWSWSDAVLEYLVVDRGLTPIVDLLHYGTPLWMDNHFVNASYPRRMGEFAAKFAERYSSIVKMYTPANEPAVTAYYCGRDGRWPPYLSGDDGYVKILLALAAGIVRTAEALRSVRADSVLVHVEDFGLERADPHDPLASAAAEDAQNRRLLPLDLACGRVVPGHAMWEWLLEHGATEPELFALAAGAAPWDVLGVNFYPWTSHRHIRVRGGKTRAVVDSPPSLLADALTMVHRRFGKPVMVTETSAPGPAVDRAQWMHDTVGAVRQARSQGVPVVGYTWFPLFTMVEWKYRWSRKAMDDHLLHLGLYDVKAGDREKRREATPLVDEYQRLLSNPSASIGEWTAGPLATPGLVA